MLKRFEYITIYVYLSILLLVIVNWYLNWARIAPGEISKVEPFSVLAVFGLYVLSHIFRMLRLAMLTLDQREQIVPLISCHAITALPSALLPFKIGEILRLGGFFFVYRSRKALSVWMSERFGDITVISLFILLLYFMQVEVPPQLKIVFIGFFTISLLAFVAFFAVAKVFTYLNRYLVLSSYSPTGLKLLKLSNQLRLLEKSIVRCFEGRVSSIFLLSVFIWATEIACISIYIRSVSSSVQGMAQFFLAGLSGVFVDGISKTSYDFFRDLVLIALAVLFGFIIAVGGLLNRR